MESTFGNLSYHDAFVHAVDLYNAKHPLVLCTDDSGVFSTSLTREYKIAASTFGKVSILSSTFGKVSADCFLVCLISRPWTEGNV